jgi:hypothetical protein
MTTSSFLDKFVYTSNWQTGFTNWFHSKYYYGGSNYRYFTFQLALNLLGQFTKNPIILETGCQRQEGDIGAGMSTSIFGEYVSKYGGHLITVDMIDNHLRICKDCTSQYKDYITYVLSDSLIFLKDYNGSVDLLYLDSVDYPIGTDAGNIAMQLLSQTHSLMEFQAIESKLHNKTLLLIDDNQLEGGGKPKLLKDYLETKNWYCLLDLQQSLWIPKW